MIYLVADIHGHLGLDWLSSELSGIDLKEDDHLIILGDAGIVWDEFNHPEVKQFYDHLPCITLFLDGNHENFDLLDRMPLETMYGGKVHRITDKIIHLIRGEVYSIDNRVLFIFGGGYSLKKKDGTSPIFIWDREMPNDAEYDNGLHNLDIAGMCVDYVLTHVAPTKIAKMIGREPVPEERVLNDYLSRISDDLSFSGWYFGHYHTDVDLGKYHCVYRRVDVLP